MILNGMTRTLLAGGVALLCAAALPAHADDKSDKADKAAVETSGTAPAPYVLAGDDIISISVVNFPNLSQPQVTIPPDGKLAVQLLDPFSVLGKTAGDVAQMLAEKWKRYVINPSVSVSLVQRRKESVLIYGAVQRPGTVDYKPPMRVLEALAHAGGPLLQGNQVLPQGVYLPQGDLSHVVVTHKNGGKQALDLSHPETRGGTSDDILLEQGDVIYVPESHTQISVIGEVLHPGTVDYHENLTVEDAVTGAGGFKETADLAGATLMHDGKESKLDLDALYHHGEGKYNIKMSPGDRLLIPEILNRTFVLGAVARPGFYNFKPGDRILDAIKGVGGPMPLANLSSVNLLHIAKDKRSAVSTPVNLQRFIQKGDIKYNQALEAGDVVFVPEKNQKSLASDIWGVLSGFNLVRGVTSIFTGRFGQ